MTPRLSALAAAAFVLISLIAVPPVSAAEPVGPGPVVDDTPAVTVVNAATARKQEVFSVEVSANAGDRRFVRTDLVVDDITLPSGLPGIFLGVSITCTDPSGATALDVEGGRNVWRSDAGFDIVVLGMLRSATAGTYSCVTEVMICDPGSCTSPASQGSVTIAEGSSGSGQQSQLSVSGALPAWARFVQIPKATDALVNPGRSLAMAKSFTFAGTTGPIAMGSVLSLTNCIVKGYPAACNAAPRMAVQGSAQVTVTMVVTQKSTTTGASCTVARAQAQTDTITWQEHHAVIDIAIPSVTLSSAPGCAPAVTATTTVRVGSGNSIAVEGGSRKVIQSATYALPGGVL
jgi:hypothetical protein